MYTINVKFDNGVTMGVPDLTPLMVFEEAYDILEKYKNALIICKNEEGKIIFKYENGELTT